MTVGRPSVVEIDRRVREVVGTTGRIVVVTDFDGTLSPIASDPPSADLLPAARTALRSLVRVAAERPDRLLVVILTGRQASDIAARVRVGGVRYVGNHGLEWGRLSGRGSGRRLAVDEAPGLEAATAAARSLADRVAGRLGGPGWLVVEPKGPAVAFHFRRAADPAAAQSAIEAAAEAWFADEAAGPGAGRTMAVLSPIRGRRVVEFRPRGEAGKAGAVARLLGEESPVGVVALGDDRSDAEAFEVVHRWRDGGQPADRRALLVGIAGSVEAPPELIARADLLLDGPADAAWLLGRLARALASTV